MRMLSKNKYDIVHMHNPPAALMAAPIAKRHDIKTVMTMHGPWARVRDKMGGLAEAIEAFCFMQCDYITFDSMSLMKEYGFSKRFFPIQNAVDYEKFKRLDKQECREWLSLSGSLPSYLYSGRNVYGKNVDTIRRLAKECVDCEFLVTGTSARMDDFELPNLKYLGSVSNDDMPKIYAAADAVILDTKAEGMSRAILEAMACEKAVFASDIEANKEAVGDTGRIFKDFDDLKKYIVELGDGDLREIGYGARKRIIDNFSIKNRIDKFINAYEHIINNG
jgi:glycosyltransferase involved in cell wall biosynthesis